MLLKKRRVVITGIGMVTSLGTEISDIWTNLLQGKSGVSKISKFDCSEHKCQIAGEIKNFDYSGIISNLDARRLDLFSLYALYATEKAVQDSGISLESENLDRIGVNLGSGMGGMNQVEKQIEIANTKGLRRVAPYAIPSVMLSAPSAEISIKYGFRGMNFSSSSACASSSHAIGLATRMIQCGEADMMISGGTEAIITPITIAGFSSARALSTRNDEPEKASRPFDKERDGFVMGEGSCILVLEEFEKAQKRNAKIYGEICGVGWTADAHHITAPDQNGDGATKAMINAITDAEISPEDVSYINAHGTSTTLNDSIETLAIKKVFGNQAYQIPISSTKSMIGHLIGAAGAVECAICALSIHNNQIHGTLNYEFPDPQCDLDYVPEKVRELSVKYALSNSFAFGGSNVALVIGKI